MLGSFVSSHLCVIFATVAPAKHLDLYLSRRLNTFNSNQSMSLNAPTRIIYSYEHMVKHGLGDLLELCTSRDKLIVGT